MSEEQKFEGHAIVEVMGHVRYVGHVSEITIAGQGFIQVNVPPNDKRQGFTKILGAGSIYAITPVSEEIAKALNAKQSDTPVHAYQLTPELTREVHRLMDDRDDEDEMF